MEKYQKILSYIDYFETLTHDEACQWSRGKQEDGVVSFSYPEYDEGLTRFVDEVYQTDLLDTSYMSTIEDYGVDHDRNTMNAAIDTANLELTKAILTFYIRHERFNEGMWATAVEEKVFYRLLLRLSDLLTK